MPTAALGHAWPQTCSRHMMGCAVSRLTQHEPQGWKQPQFAFPAQVRAPDASQMGHKEQGPDASTLLLQWGFSPPCPSWGCSPSAPGLASAVSNCNLTQPAIKHSRTGESSVGAG